MLGRTLVKRFVLSAALLGSLLMLAGATTAKANDHGGSAQFSSSLSIGNGRSGYGNDSFYGSRNRYDNNNYRDYDRYRSFTRDADRDFRGENNRDWNRNSRFDNDRDRESDRSSGWGRR
jgi:hypothetical protein